MMPPLILRFSLLLIDELCRQLCRCRHDDAAAAAAAMIAAFYLRHFR